MPTYPLPTLSAQVTPQGIQAPAINDIILSLVATMQSIFGADIYLTPDTQDYQMIVVFAMAINDSNQTIIATYNGFIPAFAQGAGLSELVGINGLQREAATNSTASVVIVGVAGTVIAGGVAQDLNGNLWDLPASVTIPISGTITVTATCQTAGAVVAGPNSINQIQTVVQGWQTVNNPGAATVGVNAESDAALRQRQAESTAIASQTPLEAIIANVANITGVTRSQIYENDTNATDGNGVPSHSVSVVVQGGSLTTIAQVIEATKAPGTGTYGSTTEIVEDPSGVPIAINFFQLVDVPIYVSLTIQPLNGYVAQDGIDLVNAIVNFINALAIGEEVYYAWIEAAAAQINLPEGVTYVVTVLTIGTAPSPGGTANIPIPFNEAATCATGNVVLTTL
jgi:uncharacterized phage protein gp47/JayE